MYALTNRSDRFVSLNYRVTEAGRLAAGRVKLIPGVRTEISDVKYNAIKDINLFLKLNEEDKIIVEQLDADSAEEVAEEEASITGEDDNTEEDE